MQESEIDHPLSTEDLSELFEHLLEEMPPISLGRNDLNQVSSERSLPASWNWSAGREDSLPKKINWSGK